MEKELVWLKATNSVMAKKKKDSTHWPRRLRKWIKSSKMVADSVPVASAASSILNCTADPFISSTMRAKLIVSGPNTSKLMPTTIHVPV